ncbi:MAG: tripartite tricarboxylate transporter permease [Desulfobacterales bacterium]|nr:tripartite tricarboxylate transporter permease [Desulfobacterales bacterium]
MFEAFIQGFFNVFHPMTFLLVIVGMIIGIIVGVLPAIGGVAGCALLLPFIYGMNPFHALPILVSLGAVSVTGGSITSILLNIPGDTPNAATLIDGYPMTRRGEAGRAIGAALTASGAGGFMGVALALVFVPVIVPVVLALHMAEMFFVVLVGISFVAILSKGGQIKGLISGGLGLLLSLVGFQTATGTARFTFDSAFLFEGLGIIPVVMGLFAGAEILELAVSEEAISQVEVAATPWRQMLQGAGDVYRHKWLWFRSSVIGYIVGVIPGIGSVGAMFMAYGQAKQTSKNQDLFGTGCVEGVIAPESANNASHGGSLLTTLAFGIPGSTQMAILLSAYLLVGIKPGPGLIIEHAELSFTMLWTSAIASLLAAGLCFLIAPYLIKVTYIHPNYLSATIAPLIFVSVFATGQTVLNIAVVVLFTLIGVVMSKLGFSRPAFILAFVLGEMLEDYFWLAVKLQGPFFFLRPISLIFIVFIIGILSFSPIKSVLDRRRERKGE